MCSPVMGADITWGTTWYVDHASGTDSETCGASAGSGACAHLNYIFSTRTWTNSGSGPVIIEVGGNSADTTKAIITAKTGNSATNYILIRASGSNRHSGVWNDGIWRLESSDGTAIDSQALYVTYDGLQVKTTGTISNNSRHVITLVNGTYTEGSNSVQISHCILVGHNDATYTQSGIYGDAGADLYIYNTIVYNIRSLSGNRGMVAAGAGSVTYIYSSTVIGGEYGIYRSGGTATVKNTYAGGSSSGDFYGTISQITNASSDVTAANTALDSIAINATNFTNVTGGSENFLLPGAGSALYNVGTDTSGDSAPLNFTTDIQGGARPYATTWDIGADEYGADGATTTTSTTSTSTTTSTAGSTTTTIRKNRMLTMGVG